MDTNTATASRNGTQAYTSEHGSVGPAWDSVRPQLSDEPQGQLRRGTSAVAVEADPRWLMNPENEAEFVLLAPRLRTFQSSDLADRFRELANTTVIPALTALAERVRALGQNCQISAAVDEPIPATGQVVSFTFDARYQPGEQSLHFRLPPGESGVRVEMPGAGSVRSALLQLSEFRVETVHRLAIDYLKTQLR